MEKIGLYRYFHLNPQKNAFSHLTSLSFVSEEECLRCVKENELAVRTYDEKYVRRRLLTEEKMYRLFSEKGGRPQTKHPYYFTFGNCDEWFYGRKNCFGALSFSLFEFDPATLSFTYGDSIPTFMEEFQDGKEYRGKVYTYEEICDLIQRFGFPNEWNPTERFGPENYVEVQVWTDEYFPFGTEKSQLLGDISHGEMARRMIEAAPRIPKEAADQISLKEGIERCKAHSLWPRFCDLLSRADEKAFHADPVHGIDHAYKCALIAFCLGVFMKRSKVEIVTLVYAALYHDLGRNHFDAGKHHGLISAEKIGEYISPSDPVSLGELKEAVEKHDLSCPSGENQYLVWLRDADSLDHIRLGIGSFDPSRLVTEQARELVRFSLELNMKVYFFDRWFQDLLGGKE